MSAQNAITTWIPESNLLLFLERVSARIGYRFEDWDWDAIRFGIRDTDLNQDRWYAYELSGTPPIAFAFARTEEAGRLRVNVAAEERMAVRIDALARIMQCYDPTTGMRDLETLIEAAFPATPRPDPNHIVACDSAHLAHCLECQDALACFRDKHWMDLLREETPLPRSVAGLGFITLEARRFFFPAYLVRALRDQDAELLEIALGSLERETWTPLQQELLDFARSLLHGNAPVRR